MARKSDRLPSLWISRESVLFLISGYLWLSMTTFTLIVAQPMTADDAKVILDKHNEYRRRESAANMYLLHWNITLQERADGWSQRCLFKHERNLEVGENLYFDTDVENDVFLRGLKMWHDEKNDWSYTSDACFTTCHYTQMVTGYTTTVGCSANVCGSLRVGDQVFHNAMLLVCYYYPRGNFVGNFPFEHGAPCSKCAEGDTCSKGLCITSSEESKTAPEFIKSLRPVKPFSPHRPIKEISRFKALVQTLRKTQSTTTSGHQHPGRSQQQHNHQHPRHHHNHHHSHLGSSDRVKFVQSIRRPVSQPQTQSSRHLASTYEKEERIISSTKTNNYDYGRREKERFKPVYEESRQRQEKRRREEEKKREQEIRRIVALRKKEALRLKEQREREMQRKLKEDRERRDGERKEQERLERHRLEKERERLEIERREEESRERRRLEKLHLERLRQEQERLERERKEKGRLERERQEKERLEIERKEKERLEKERKEQERLERERLERESKENGRLERELEEKERLERELEEKERLEIEQEEQERLEKERKEQERLERERLERESKEKERLEREREEQERIERERKEKEHLEREREEQLRLERERKEQERLQREREEQSRLEQEGRERQGKRILFNEIFNNLSQIIESQNTGQKPQTSRTNHSNVAVTPATSRHHHTRHPSPHSLHQHNHNHAHNDEHTTNGAHTPTRSFKKSQFLYQTSTSKYSSTIAKVSRVSPQYNHNHNHNPTSGINSSRPSTEKAIDVVENNSYEDKSNYIISSREKMPASTSSNIIQRVRSSSFQTLPSHTRQNTRQLNNAHTVRLPNALTTHLGPTNTGSTFIATVVKIKPATNQESHSDNSRNTSGSLDSQVSRGTSNNASKTGSSKSSSNYVKPGPNETVNYVASKGKVRFPMSEKALKRAKRRRRRLRRQMMARLRKQRHPHKDKFEFDHKGRRCVDRLPTCSQWVDKCQKSAVVSLSCQLSCGKCGQHLDVGALLRNGSRHDSMLFSNEIGDGGPSPALTTRWKKHKNKSNETPEPQALILKPGKQGEGTPVTKTSRQLRTRRKRLRARKGGRKTRRRKKGGKKNRQRNSSKTNALCRDDPSYVMDCRFWARRGFCSDNWIVRNLHCRWSCGECD